MFSWIGKRYEADAEKISALYSQGLNLSKWRRGGGVGISGCEYCQNIPEYPGISLFVSPSFYIYYDTYTSLIIVNRMGEGHRSFGIWYSKRNPNFKNQPITCLTTYFCLKQQELQNQMKTATSGHFKTPISTLNYTIFL